MRRSIDIDFSFDPNTTDEFFDGLATLDDQQSRFSAAVPPHIAPETIAHWDLDELW